MLQHLAEVLSIRLTEIDLELRTVESERDDGDIV
jgi:hypothetical protein